MCEKQDCLLILVLILRSRFKFDLYNFFLKGWVNTVNDFLILKINTLKRVESLNFVRLGIFVSCALYVSRA